LRKATAKAFPLNAEKALNAYISKVSAKIVRAALRCSSSKSFAESHHFSKLAQIGFATIARRRKSGIAVEPGNPAHLAKRRFSAKVLEI
jgi:hypothetical protein